MGKVRHPRHPRSYNEGPRKQMTPAWKALVLARLEDNKRDEKSPASLGEMAGMLRKSDGRKADKAGITRTFKTEQMSSSYVDAICDLLDLPPPLAETSDDQELENDVDFVRGMDPERRRELMTIARRMK